MSVIELTTGELRPWRAGDASGLVRHANNRNVSANLRDRFPFPYLEEHAAEWIGMTSQDSPPYRRLAIAIGGEAVGGIGVELLSDIHRRSAEIGYWLGELHWGRGIMTEAVQAMTRYALEHFDLCRVFAGVFDSNPASARVLEKAGYRLEGRMRRSVIKDGHMRDELIYAYVVDGEDESTLSHR